ncbi:hypothetical protein ECB90_01790 [Helicobacter pylori]|uniref:hypothetical protein n=1 Tax=Helicobacter pylori TaxID=210 RepID=UPI000FDF23D2|nr:hypothetical protein [Helicobacter pylori]RVY09842.1 hypothetical protein ECB90_01790 [Helicobacter pylori]
MYYLLFCCFILFWRCCFILFGKEKTILDAMMNIIFVIIVACIFFPWLPGLLFYPIMYLLLHVIPY